MPCPTRQTVYSSATFSLTPTAIPSAAATAGGSSAARVALPLQNNSAAHGYENGGWDAQAAAKRGEKKVEIGSDRIKWDRQETGQGQGSARHHRRYATAPAKLRVFKHNGGLGST